MNTKTWREGVPSLKKGESRLCIVTYEHKGKRRVSTARYLQEYWMEWADSADPDDDDIDDDGGARWTGWFRDSEVENGDPSTWRFEPQVIGWLELPEPMDDDLAVKWKDEAPADLISHENQNCSA